MIMKINLNALIIGKAGEGLPATVSLTPKAGYGLSISGIPEGMSNAMLLRILTAMTSSGFRADELPFHIHVSNCGVNPSSVILAVAVALLIASGQIKPVVELEDLILYGDLRLDGKMVESYTSGKNGIPTEWPRRNTQFLTDHTLMHIVPDGTDSGLKMTIMGPYTIEATDLKHIKDILENKKNEH